MHLVSIECDGRIKMQQEHSIVILGKYFGFFVENNKKEWSDQGG